MQTLLALLFAMLLQAGPVTTSVHLKPGDTIPSTKFVDQTGRQVSFDAWRGKFVVLSFIYTRCRDANECPLISAKYQQLQSKLGPNAHLVEMSIDPEYDRPPVLAKYARVFQFKPDRVTLLTGEPKTILEFAAMFGVTAYTDPKYGFVHNENTVIIDPEGKIADYLPEATWPADEIVSQIANYSIRPRPFGGEFARLFLWVAAFIATGALLAVTFVKLFGRNRVRQ